MSIQNPASDTVAMQAYLAAAQIDIAEGEIVRFHAAVPDGLFRSYLDSVYSIDSVQGLKDKTGSISLANKGLTNLTGIEYATGISTIIANGNDIAGSIDLSAITGLTYMEIQANDLDSIGNLSRMTSLTFFRGYNNNLTTLGDLSDLSSMVTFQIYSNAITDIGSVATWLSLTNFYAINNQFAQATIETLIDEFWVNRVTLGAAGCYINLASNPGSAAAAISRASKITDLNTAGCTAIV